MFPREPASEVARPATSTDVHAVAGLLEPFVGATRATSGTPGAANQSSGMAETISTRNCWFGHAVRLPAALMLSPMVSSGEVCTK